VDITLLGVITGDLKLIAKSLVMIGKAGDSF